MEKTKYYQVVMKDGKSKKIVSPSTTELDALSADGWEVFGFDDDADIPKNPIADNGELREKTSEEINEEIQSKKLARTIFTKIEIREAFKALTLESMLDDILNQSADFKNYWLESEQIDLNHPVAIEALQNITTEQINDLKTEISGV